MKTFLFQDGVRLIEGKVRSWNFRAFSIHGDKKQDMWQKHSCFVFVVNMGGCEGEGAAPFSPAYRGPRLEVPKSGCLERMLSVPELRGRAAVLVATDVAARGLDIPDITCVVHFDLPKRRGSV